MARERWCVVQFATKTITTLSNGFERFVFDNLDRSSEDYIEFKQLLGHHRHLVTSNHLLEFALEFFQYFARFDVFTLQPAVSS